MIVAHHPVFLHFDSGTFGKSQTFENLVKTRVSALPKKGYNIPYSDRLQLIR